MHYIVISSLKFAIIPHPDLKFKFYLCNKQYSDFVSAPRHFASVNQSACINPGKFLRFNIGYNCITLVRLYCCNYNRNTVQFRNKYCHSCARSTPAKRSNHKVYTLIKLYTTVTCTIRSAINIPTLHIQ